MTKTKRRPSEMPEAELLVYDIAHQRWRDLTAEQILDEAATLFNLAVFLAQHKMRQPVAGDPHGE